MIVSRGLVSSVVLVAGLSAIGCGGPGEGTTSAPASSDGSADPGEGSVAASALARTQSLIVPTGTTFEVHLDERLATGENRVGDPFSATLTDPIVDLQGQVLLPAGSTVRGRVTGIIGPDHLGDTASIRLAFEAVSFEGRSYPLQGMVVEATPEERERRRPAQEAARRRPRPASSRGEGDPMGDPADLSSLGGSSATGTSIRLGSANLDLVLPSGSRVVVRLASPVEVRRVAH